MIGQATTAFGDPRQRLVVLLCLLLLGAACTTADSVSILETQPGRYAEFVSPETESITVRGTAESNGSLTVLVRTLDEGSVVASRSFELSSGDFELNLSLDASLERDGWYETLIESRGQEDVVARWRVDPLGLPLEDTSDLRRGVLVRYNERIRSRDWIGGFAFRPIVGGGAEQADDLLFAGLGLGGQSSCASTTSASFGRDGRDGSEDDLEPDIDFQNPTLSSGEALVPLWLTGQDLNGEFVNVYTWLHVQRLAVSYRPDGDDPPVVEVVGAFEVAPFEERLGLAGTCTSPFLGDDDGCVQCPFDRQAQCIPFPSRIHGELHTSATFPRPYSCEEALSSCTDPEQIASCA